ncbi:MAG: hypothetical protein H6Q77_1957 [Gemmatimonadetes bacterium]|nr:hypothetical protein [Gemmatimonadota bacterium]
MTRALLFATLALAAAGAAQAQTLREYSSTRQDHGESRLATTVQYAGGTLSLVPAPSGILYALRLTYDADRFAPVARFDPAVPRLMLGTEALARSGGVRVSHRGTPPAATIALGTRADLDLDIELGAAEATLELGGIRISRLKLQTGASKTVLRFSEANPIRCTGAELSAGAAELMVTGLGYARCREVDFTGGVGRVTLDFSGRWAGPMRLEATMAMGELVLRLPKRAGIKLELDKFLASFAPAGLVRSADGRTWSSAGFADASQQLVVDLETAFGGVTVEWID